MYVTLTLPPQGDGNAQDGSVANHLAQLRLHLPRKGMETSSVGADALLIQSSYAYTSPARGWKLHNTATFKTIVTLLRLHFPRKGMETLIENTGIDSMLTVTLTLPP